ncbi:Lens epithelium-derived growth factor [Halotydeus destructor]|nr:Lens epithelium-derived growth factor [Halotydeus destructor]
MDNSETEVPEESMDINQEDGELLIDEKPTPRPKKRAAAKSGPKKGSKGTKKKAAAPKKKATKNIETSVKPPKRSRKSSEPLTPNNATTKDKPGADVPDSPKIIDKSEAMKAKLVQKERLKNELKLAKLEKKRQERLEALKSHAVTAKTLRDFETEIVESLDVAKTDTKRCLTVMSKLDLINVNQVVLAEYPSLLQILKKCRKYKSDESIRMKSDYLYNKFKSLFLNGLDEALLKKDSNSNSNSPTRDKPRPDEAATGIPLDGNRPVPESNNEASNTSETAKETV